MGSRELVVGTVGSGKTTALVHRALAESAASRRVVFVCPSRARCADVRAILKADCKIELVSAPQLLATDSATFLLQFDTVLLDDLDSPVGFRGNMRSIILPAGLMAVATSRKPLRGWEVVQTLTESHRVPTCLMQLLAGKKLDEDVLPLPLTLHPETDRASAVFSLLLHSRVQPGRSTVVLCAAELSIQLLDRAPVLNAVREKQQIGPPLVLAYVPMHSNREPPLADVVLTPVSNFFGRQAEHVVLVLDAADRLGAVVEGMTRHTDSLAVVFDPAQPPEPLCDRAAVLAPLLPKDVFVNWSPRASSSSSNPRSAQQQQQQPASRSVRELVAQIIAASTDSAIAAASSRQDVDKRPRQQVFEEQLLQHAAQRLFVMQQQQRQQVVCTKLFDLGTDCPPAVPDVDLRLLGSVVEDMVCIKLGLPPQPGSVLVSTQWPATTALIRTACAQDGMWTAAQEEALWTAIAAAGSGSGGGENVSTHKIAPAAAAAAAAAGAAYFSRMAERARRLCRVLTQQQQQVPLRTQVPCTFAGCSGVADVVLTSAVLEIKNTKTTEAEGMVQTLVYMLALDKPVGYLFNARWGQLFKLELLVT